tara:strand:+ start:1443 stop:1673 length:231 start_codon:yes stop_codon:yes gene_type:complete
MGNSCSSKNKIAPTQSSVEKNAAQNANQGWEWTDRARQKCIERGIPEQKPPTSLEILKIRGALKTKTTELDRNKNR